MAKKASIPRVMLNPSTSPKVPKSFRVPDGMDKGTYDSLQNLITGLGTSKDKMQGTQFVFSELSKGQLEAAYRSDWIARKVIDIPAQDSTREWRAWQSDKADIGDLEKLEKTLYLQRKVKTALQKARLYGGAALLMGVDNGSLDKELIPEKVQKDQLKFVHVVSRYELSAGEIDWDINSEYYGTPKYYTRAGGGPTEMGGRIHPSRVVRFIGSEVPDLSITAGWGDSILQVVNDAVMSAGMVCTNGSQLVNELKMDIIKIPDLAASLSHKEYATRLNERFSLANVAKSLYNILLLDKEEDWERITANLTGLPDVLRMYLLIASGAADIPATRMLGQSPAGLSATGESDLRNYYDHVKSEQQTVQQPAMMKLDEILIRSALGTANPDDVTFLWNPLWQLDEMQKSTITGQKATSFKTDVDAGLIPSEVLRDARINQLIEDGLYPGLEQILDDYGPLEPIDDNPELGSVIGPDGQPISPNDPAHPANQQKFDPKTGQPMQPGGNVVPIKKKKAVGAVGDMAGRIRKANPRSKKYRYSDGVVRTLYIRRDVLNADEILAWAQQRGIPDLMPATELHVTICYSKTPVDWAKTGSAWDEDQDGTMTIRPGGMRALDKLGNAIVLLFNSSTLAWRHVDLKSLANTTSDYEDYQPHVTLSYSDKPFDLKGEAYPGKIELGPEIYAEIEYDYQGTA